jgi:hypothetical protein
MIILKEFFEDILTGGERIVKDVLDKDVPKSPLRGHEDIKEQIEKKLLDFFADIAEKMWPVAQEFGLTRAQFDQLVKIGADEIISDDDDEDAIAE